jgi:hypothetical protein
VIESALRIGARAPETVAADAEPPARLPLDTDSDGAERAALAVPMTPAETAAADYARRSAAAYLEAAASDLGAQVRQALAAADYARVQAQIGDAIESRDTSLSALRHRIAEVVEDAANVNIDRIARTEIASAYNAGQAVSLAAAAQDAGIIDPQVFRLASPAACVDCLRLLGPPSAPVVYRLSELRAHDAGGGNVGRPRQAWRAGTGPIHPNCGCSGPFLWRPGRTEAINAAADRIAAL